LEEISHIVKILQDAWEMAFFTTLGII